MLLVRKKVNHIAKGTCSAFVQFRVATMGTRNRGELFVLHIKNFGESPTGGAHFVHFVLFVAAFWADVFLFFHDIKLACHSDQG
jgi:hypothetical protein